MSFGVSCRDTGFEYSSRGLQGFFADRLNVLRPNHYSLLREILQFNRRAGEDLCSGAASDLSLAEYLRLRNPGRLLRERYLYPMASAVWSTSTAAIESFPAATLLRFFENHGMLGLQTHPTWKTVRGGSSAYIGPLVRPYQRQIRLGAGLTKVERSENSVLLRFEDSEAQRFDHAVLACHAPQALRLIDRPSTAEQQILSSFQTSANDTKLHTDASLLPRRPRARASWNYHLGGTGSTAATLTYHMNRLQALDTPENYCVTLNDGGAVSPAHLLRSMTYHHPLFTTAAVGAQGRWAEISGVNRIHYCGAYWFYGFHEDGLNSAIRVAGTLGVEW